VAESAIEWTDATWNPVTGCDRVSPGCAHCYALTLAKRLKAMGNPRYQVDGGPASGPGFGVTLHEDKLEEPLRWRRPRMVFVNSMSDLFHEEIPDEYIDRVFATMAAAPQHTFQVLTKRPERMLAWATRHDAELAHDGLRAEPWPNVWLGVTIENRRFVHRADLLRETPAAVRFVSAEPLLGPLDELDLSGIDWLICGAESGPGCRRFDFQWARDLRDACLSQCRDCAALGVHVPDDWAPSYQDDHTHWAPCTRRTAFFLKQLGGHPNKRGGDQALLDGRLHHEMPAAAQ
jgi:protein gp37